MKAGDRRKRAGAARLVRRGIARGISGVSQTEIKARANLNAPRTTAPGNHSDMHEADESSIDISPVKYQTELALLACATASARLVFVFVFVFHLSLSRIDMVVVIRVES